MATRQAIVVRDFWFEFTLHSGESAVIRNMQLDDIVEVHELENLIFQDAWSLASFHYEVARSKVSWPLVAESHHEVIGYAVPWFVEDELHIANIAASPIYRRQGIAAQLMAVMLAEAQRRQVTKAYLEVRVSNNIAIQMYERYGFQKISLRRRYYHNGEDAIVMQKQLTQQSKPNLSVLETC